MNRPGLILMVAGIISWLVGHVYPGSNEGIVSDLNCNFDLYFPSTNYFSYLINPILLHIMIALMTFDPFLNCA